MTRQVQGQWRKSLKTDPPLPSRGEGDELEKNAKIKIREISEIRC